MQGPAPQQPHPIPSAGPSSCPGRSRPPPAPHALQPTWMTPVPFVTSGAGPSAAVGWATGLLAGADTDADSAGGGASAVESSRAGRRVSALTGALAGAAAFPRGSDRPGVIHPAGVDVV